MERLRKQVHAYMLCEFDSVYQNFKRLPVDPVISWNLPYKLTYTGVLICIHMFLCKLVFNCKTPKQPHEVYPFVLIQKSLPKHSDPILVENRHRVYTHVSK